MTPKAPRYEQLAAEIQYVVSRSSGPGGQNVNKVSSKVTLRFNVPNSVLLTVEQKEVILKKLASRLTKEGVLVISSQEKRSQLDNKAEVQSKLDQLLVNAFAVKKVRKASKVSKAATRARLQEKKHRSEKKQWRRKENGSGG